jgi:hypothetical protein
MANDLDENRLFRIHSWRNMTFGTKTNPGGKGWQSWLHVLEHSSYKPGIDHLLEK